MYPELTDYINKSRQSGMSEDLIIKNLLSNGWTEEDIKLASEPPQSSPSLAIPGSPSMARTQRVEQSDFTLRSPMAVLKALALLLVVLSLVGGGYFFYIKQKTTESPIQEEALTLDPETAQTTSADTDPDIARVRVILEDIRQAYLKEDIALLAKHASTETAKLFSSDSKIGPVSAFTINSVNRSGANIIVNMSAVYEGEPATQDMIFIKEGNDWKFDIMTPLQVENES